MKRKLNEEDVPTVVETVTEETVSHTSSFNSLGLDSRLLQAIAKQNFTEPTSVQSKAIPLALAGKDVLARSKTGSGKTAAYVLPILQSILQKKITGKAEKATSSLVLVPSRELAQQVSKAISTFSSFCAKDVRTVNLTQKFPESVQRSLLAELPDIVVATPARVAQNLDSGGLTLENLTQLVIDEADLVLSYGYLEDLQVIANAIPKGVQTCLMSATLSTEVDALRGLFCRDPVVLDQQEKENESEGLSQYIVQCGEDEKFLLAYVVFKLKLVKGKCIIFVSDIDRCYRLKLFFEQFGIRSCVLNSELPVNSRIHVVEEFNKNVYDIIIASDEQEVLGEEDTKQQFEEGTANAANTSKPLSPDAATAPAAPQKKRQKKSKKEQDYGVSRGIDFQFVACVLNFDFPSNPSSYTHRIGRTARAGHTGLALSFVIPPAHHGKSKSTGISSTATDTTVLDAVTADQAAKGAKILPYRFSPSQIEGFRYRMQSALKSVTRLAVREARARELRQELLKSEKLSRYFEENPEEKRALRHDAETRVVRVRGELRHVPEYLMPQGGKAVVVGGEGVGFVPLRKAEGRRGRGQVKVKGQGGAGRKKGGNVLRSFRVGGKK